MRSYYHIQSFILKLLLIVMITVFFYNTTQAVQHKQWQERVNQLVQEGQYADAVTLINHISKNFHQTSKDYLISQIMKANIFKLMGRHKKALFLLAPIISMIQHKSSPELYVRYYNTKGNILVSLSKPEEASKMFERSLKFARQSRDLQLVCEVLNEIGLLYYAYSNYPGYINKSIETFEEAIRYSNSIQTNTAKHRLFHAQLMIHLARALMAQDGKYQKVDKLKQIDKAFDYVSRLTDTYQKARQLFKIVDLYEKIAKQNQPLRDTYLKRAYRIYQHISAMNQHIKDDRLASLVFSRQAALYETANQLDDAISLTRQSLFYAQKIKASHKLYKLHWQLGRLYQKKGNIDTAIPQYEKAIEILSPIRQQVYHSDLNHKNVFNQKIKPVYLELAEIYFEKANASSPNSKIYNTNIRNTWITMDKVKMAELEDIFQDECVSSKKENYLKLGESLGPVAVLYVIPFQTQPGVIMYLPDGFKHFRLDVDTQRFNQTIQKLRHSIQSFEDFESYATLLYKWIITPIYADLKRQKVETLVVASDGALRTLPFSVFLSPDETFLIEEFEIVTIPALHLTRTAITNRASPSIMLCGISKKKVIGKTIFPALPRVVQELEEINKIVSGEIFLNESFSQKNMTQNLLQKKYTIIHMATHGEFGGTPERTFLLTHDKRLNMNSLEQLIKLSRSSSIDLLTLSACQTALGDERAAFGLAGIAVKAGVNCAIATLWSVDDFSSQRIITDFYKNAYRHKMSKAKALQQAQISLINEIQYWQPLFWAAFLLIGNWY
jgi:CHAT domain-containing protein